MAQFIDRRLNGKNKSAVNRQRFLRRYRNQIKKALSDSMVKRSITDIDTGEQIKISTKDVNEPVIKYDKGGVVNYIIPGNKDYVKGDHIPRPPPAGSETQGSQASNTGEGEDDFVFNVSREEFLDMYFDDLELPDLIKKQVTTIPDYKSIRAGYTIHGSPSNISVIRSMRHATARRMALRGPHKKKLKQLQKEYESIDKKSKRAKELLAEISALEAKIAGIPYIETIDIRYRNRVKEKRPATQAVMFCVMDVSGSMDEVKKDIAKRFFILLYLFLKRNYEQIELVFVRHHTSAKEVDENEFFYSRETGGTVVSSALELVREIITTRYNSDNWNIYVAQASDGDNWNADSPYCQKIILNDIIPKIQYYAYVEIMPRHHQSLWESYLKINDKSANFAMQNIDKLSDIYPVFRELFKRQLA